MGGEFGEEWILVCIWLSPFIVHLKLLLISSTPNIKLKVKKNKICSKKKKKVYFQNYHQSYIPGA